jgi:hypothetical protein
MVGRSKIFRMIDPRTSPEHPSSAIGIASQPGRAIRRRSDVAIVGAVFYPFVDVTVDLIKPPGIGAWSRSASSLINRPRTGIPNVYAQRSRFLPQSVLSLFEMRSWPILEGQTNTRSAAALSGVDIGARMRAMWR